MSTEQFSNNAVTALSGSINSSVTSLGVVSAGSFPTTGNFRIVVDSEIMLVTAVSGTTFTVLRAQEGTTAASHSNAAVVSHVMTAGAIDAVRSDSVLANVIANLPAAGKAGRIYVPTDDSVVLRDTGSLWQSFGPVMPVTLPVLANFSVFNSNAAFTQSGGAGGSMYLHDTGGASGGLRGLSTAIPGATHTITLGFIPFFVPGLTTSDMGIWIGDGTKLAVGTLQTNNQPWSRVVNLYNSVTSFSGNPYVSLAYDYAMPMVWMRIADDGTHRNWQLSCDGQHWDTYYQVATNNFLTPTVCGMFLDSAGGQPKGMKVLHWSATTP